MNNLAPVGDDVESSVSEIRQLLEQHRAANSPYLQLSLLELEQANCDLSQVHEKILYLLFFSELVSVQLQLVPKSDHHPYLPFPEDLIQKYGQALTSVRIPKSFGSLWLFTAGSSIACSCLLNKLMCRWFDCPRSEIAAFNLQPLSSRLRIKVRAVPHGAERRITAEAITFSARLISMHHRLGLYPSLVSSLNSPRSLFVDLVILEIPLGIDINSIRASLYINKVSGVRIDKVSGLFSDDKVSSNQLTIPIVGSSALLLQDGKDSRLYALSLSEELLLTSESDVADYLRGLYEWIDEPYGVPPPATLLDETMCFLERRELPFHVFIWTLT